MKVLKGFLIFIGVLLVAALLFSIVVFVVGGIQHLSFYEVLKSWFGSGSWFAGLFNSAEGIVQ